MILRALLLFGAVSLVSSKVVLSDLNYQPGNITKESILKNHQKILNKKCDETRATMAILSDNNVNGYELALKTTNSLTHVSPSWFTIRPKIYHLNGKRIVELFITGHENINNTWIQVLREKNPAVKIVPEFKIDDFPPEEAIEELLTNPVQMERVARQLAQLCQSLGVDGLVIDMFEPILSGFTHKSSMTGLETMTQLGKFVMKKKLIAIIVVHPAQKTVERPMDFPGTLGVDNHEDCALLTDAFDYVLVKTNEEMHIDNQLRDWQTWTMTNTKCFKDKKKVMVGINFHGYEYQSTDIKYDDTDMAGIVDSERFLEVLKMDDSWLEFYDTSNGHALLSKSLQKALFYPTLTSLEYRFAVAQKNKFSVAISSYGSGLNYFTILLPDRNLFDAKAVLQYLRKLNLA